jgi:Bacterial pre-peptidase C-terminal domain
MRTRLLAGLFATSLLLTLGAPACSDGGTGGEGGSGSTTSSVTTSSVTTTGVGGEAESDGNDDFATAEKLTVGASIDAYLEPWSDLDFYVFQGAKGQAISFSIKAQEVPFDPRTIDTALTLFDASKTRIAENDQPVPRSSDDAQLFTILPADGTYYLRVAECWTWSSDTSACAKPKVKLSTAYTLRVVDLSVAAPGVVADPEKGNDVASAAAVTYAAAPEKGARPLAVVYGRFDAADDVDVYSFEIPPDLVTVAPGARLVGTEWLLREGPDGDGATTPVGKVYITTQADPTKRLAQIDGGDFGGYGSRLWPPLDSGVPYYLFIEHPGAPLGANDFYVDLHGANSSRPLEQADIENDAAATPEALVVVEDGSFYIEGDIGSAAADVDHFSFDVAGQAGKTVTASCISQRAGSGLLGFEVDLIDAATLTPLAIVKETPQTNAYTQAIPVPDGASKMILKLSAAAQDPAVSGTFYRCGVHFQ